MRRVSIERLIVACAALTAAGAAMRGIGGAAGLYAGTLLAGAAVAVVQSAIPALLRARFPRHAGSLVGGFSMALVAGAAIAAGLAVPLEDWLGGWRAALAAFAVPAALAALVWLTPASRTRVLRQQAFGFRNLARSWSIAAYFGLQSMSFYCALTWLPASLEEDGYSEAAAGALQALGHAMQVVPALLVPVVAARRANQRGVLVVGASVAASGFVGLLLAPDAAVLWMVLVGLGHGAGLGLGLLLPALRGAGAHAVATLTALALSGGYLIAAIGPPLVGLAHDLSDGWTLPLALIAAITFAQTIPGWFAAGPWTVGARDAS